jgi:predicted chitinase
MADSKPINWAYPFKTTGASTNPLQYLTNMAKANGGYYPTGENGLWHGGVHFDKGTAAVFDQSSVHCIADGEVIAYRINESYPVSEYTEAIPQIKRVPFSTGFVLVKHTLRPPQPINARSTHSEQSPPTLTLFSLYMHLQDWAGYQAKAELARPAFWEAAIYIVDTKDHGLNVRAEPNTNGTHLAVLAKGTQVTVSHLEGDYCKLLSIVSGAAEPALTPDSEGKLPGFVAFKLLKAQHEPKAKDSVVVLDPGIAIKAGDLIGHLGTYQNHNGAAQPLLHLEVFSCEDVPGFISKSQAWARTLPETDKTLLKIHKDASRLISHRDDIKEDNPPKLDDTGSQIGVDLIIPQALLDGLPAAKKIKISTTVAGNSTPQTTNWWRLDGLFADKEGNPINGWLAEQDLITTRHSPWEWPDFQCIEDTGKPVEKLAYTFNARGMLSEEEKHNYRAQISTADGGPILAIARLYDIVDTDKDGVLTREEIRAALGKPWHAQVLGQLITKYESEWFWNKSKWDELDPLLAEEPGKPNPIWEIEKQRIEKLSWWKELAGQHGISEDGRAWHFHAPMLATNFRSQRKNSCYKCNKDISITYELMKKICPSATTEDFINKFILHTGSFFEKYEVNSCAQVTHLLAQAKHETKLFTAFRESLYYSSYTAQNLYNIAPTAINNGLTRKGLTFSTHAAKLQYIEDNLLRNDAGYGQHCFGSNEYPDNDYRGRGLLHLTHYTNYHACSLAIGKPIAAEPALVQSDVAVIVETGLWFWKTNKLKAHAENTALTEEEAVKKITRIINGGEKGLAERKQFKREITGVFIELYGNCSA